MTVQITQESLGWHSSIIHSDSWNEAVNEIIRRIEKGGVIKVFTEDTLALIVKSEKLKQQPKVQTYSDLKIAVKAYQMNVEHGVFSPTVEVC